MKGLAVAQALPPLSVAYERLAEKLRAADFRVTRQRMMLAHLLFSGGDRHVTAEQLHAEARHAGLKLSLATVYNTLNRFSQAGLLNQVRLDNSRTYFDTNLDTHHHFYAKQGGGLIDIDAAAIKIGKLPKIPDGFEVAEVEVVVRLKPIKA